MKFYKKSIFFILRVEIMMYAKSNYVRISYRL